jgi:hypothetical protein
LKKITEKDKTHRGVVMPVKEEEVNYIFSVIHTGALRIP